MFEAHGDEPDKEYPIFCRKEGSLEASEEVILDQNELARSTGYCNLGVVRVSPDHRLLAYSLDLDGSERFTLRVKDLETSMLLPDILAGASDSVEWLDDSRSFVYATLDPSMRPHQAVLHRLEEPPSEDLVPWTERDERFFVGLSKSKSKRYLFVELESKATTAFHCLDLKSSHVSLTAWSREAKVTSTSSSITATRSLSALTTLCPHQRRD